MTLHKTNKLHLVTPVLFVGLALLAWMALPTGMNAGPANKGEELFKSKCAGCHGPDGSGKTAMGKMMKLRDLGSPEVQKLSDAQIHTIIEKGKSPMPSFGSQLNKTEMSELVSYIRELGKKEKK